MNVLITGGAGFIGSHLQDAFLNLGSAVTIFDDLSWGKRTNISDSAELVEGTVLDEEALFHSMRRNKIDLVIHCAASLEVTLSQDNPVIDLDVNTRGTINVLEAMRKAGVARLVNFSSACVYGFGEIGMGPSVVGKTEIAPQWGYGSSKASAEIYISQFAKTYGLCVTNIRPGIICGPREWYGRVLTIFLKRALQGESLVVFGNGEQERDFTHVADVVELVTAELDQRGSEHGVRTYNAGTGSATSTRDLARLVADMFDVDVEYEDVGEGMVSKRVQGRIRLPFEMQSMRLDMSSAHADLKLKPPRDLHQILSDEVSWLTTIDLNDWSSQLKV